MAIATPSRKRARPTAAIPRPPRPRPAKAAPADADTPRFIGADIRGLRKARGQTLAQLAAACGLSVGYLSLLERNCATPSINAQYAVSRALGVTVSWFFEAGRAPPGERDYIVRYANRRRLDYSPGITDELLSPHLAGTLELLRSGFAPGAASGDAPYTHNGEEAGVVLRGRLELWIDGRRFELHAGDSFGFPSHLPHRYRNPGPDEAEVIWAIAPPSY